MVKPRSAAPSDSPAKTRHLRVRTPLVGVLAAGCAISMAMYAGQASGAVGHSSHGSALRTSKTAGTNQDLTTYVEPSATYSPIYNAINDASSSIDLTMYELEDTTAEQDLASAASRGVDVRVILDEAEQSSNQAAYNYLNSNGVHVVWSSTSFTYTHQKTLTTDNSESWIMTGNLQTQYYSTSRDFIVADTDSNDVNAIVDVFDADYAHTSITPPTGDDLIWSPGSETALENLINSANSSILVENEELSASGIVDALCNQAQAGVSVTVVMEANSSYDSEFSDLTGCGATVDLYPSSASLYIHAKAVVVDDDNAYAGSINFTDNSMDDNRELGIITANSNVVSTLSSTIQADAQNAPETYGSN